MSTADDTGPEEIRWVAGVVLTGSGGALVGIAGIRTLTGEAVMGMHAGVGLAVGVAVLIGAMVALPGKHTVVDPRTGRELEQVRRAGRRALLVVGATVGLFLAFILVVSLTLG